MATPRNMLLGFGIGLISGLLVYSFVDPTSPWLQWGMTYITGPVGTIFLRALMMLVIPLVFSALVVGVASMNDARELARLGLRMAAFALVSTTLAVTSGIVLMNVFQPGKSFDTATSATMIQESQGRIQDIMSAGAEVSSGLNLVLNIVPTNVLGAIVRNDILAVLFFSIFFGVALVATQTRASKVLLQGIEGLFDITMKMIEWVISIAPFAIACLVFDSVAIAGWGVLGKLSGYVGVVLLAMSVHALLFYPLMLRFGANRDPLQFARDSREAVVMAFSTSSSTATLPTTLRVAEHNLKLPPSITRFVVTVGATANQNGTALFEGVTVLFLAQLAGVHLDLSQQILLMVVCVLGGIGTAGVPAGSLPVIAMICVMFGIPPEGLGIVLGVDRFLDMCRTSINVSGDLVASAVLTNWDERADGAGSEAVEA